MKTSRSGRRASLPARSDMCFQMSQPDVFFRRTAPRHSGVLQRAYGAAHRRACAGPTMLDGGFGFGAAFAKSPAVLGTMDGVMSALPPMNVLRMRVFILISVVAVLWVVVSAMMKVVNALWGKFSGAGSVDTIERRLKKAIEQREEADRQASTLKVQLMQIRNSESMATQTAAQTAQTAAQTAAGQDGPVLGGFKRSAHLVGDVKRTLAHTTAEHAQTEGTMARTAVLERDARGSVVENWEMVKGMGTDQEYLLLNHMESGMKIELPVEGVGVLFSSGDGVVRRCWADGTFYERFAFRTGDTLMHAPGAQAMSLGTSLRVHGDVMGKWSWFFQEQGRVTVSHNNGNEVLYLLPDGFAFFGGQAAPRGVLVLGNSKQPEVMQAPKLRAHIGLDPVASTTIHRLGGMPRGVEDLRGQKKDSDKVDEFIPKELLCKLTGSLMRDPWIAADGCSYERQAILKWFESRGARSPTTGLALADTRLIPNNALRAIIASFTEEETR